MAPVGVRTARHAAGAEACRAQVSGMRASGDSTPVLRHADRRLASGRRRSADAHNVAIPPSGSYWPKGGQTYQVQVRFTPTSGSRHIAALSRLHAIEALGD